MSDYYDFEDYEESDSKITDPAEVKAKETIRDFFDRNQEGVFFSRQIEVLHEDRYFHWITNRAIACKFAASSLGNLGDRTSVTVAQQYI